MARLTGTLDCRRLKLRRRHGLGNRRPLLLATPVLRCSGLCVATITDELTIVGPVPHQAGAPLSHALARRRPRGAANSARNISSSLREAALRKPPRRVTVTIS